MAILAFVGEHVVEILFSLVSAGALAFCRYLYKQNKYYKGLELKEKEEKLDSKIEEKITPVLEEIEELRDYIRNTELKENKDIKLIVSSYRFRLIQLCRLYLKQGYMTEDQFEQINAFYDLYRKLGGNGEAEVYYEKVKELEIIPD